MNALYSWIFLFVPVRSWKYKLYHRHKVSLPAPVVKRNIKNKVRKGLGYEIDFLKPKRFGEKIQVSKFVCRSPKMVRLADKYRVRQYIEETGYSKILVQLYSAVDSVDQIDFEALPESFVVKVNYDSGGVFVVKNKGLCDLVELKKDISRVMQKPFVKGLKFGEWNYQKIAPKIIVEEYLEGESGDLIDFKIHCFAGEPKFIQVDSERFSGHKRLIYDCDWNVCEFQIGDYDRGLPIERPGELKGMLDCAEFFSKEFPYLRVDFYCANEKFYFGEFTFFHASGFTVVEPEEWDFKLGEMFVLPERETV